MENATGKDYGYRTEQLFGEGYRNAAKVMAHETFQLENTDILDFLSDGILKGTPIGRKMKRISDVMSEVMEDDDLSEFLNDAFEDDEVGEQFFMEVVKTIESITKQKLSYVLWLCDSIEDVTQEYEIEGSDSFDTFAYYAAGFIVLADLGRGGKLYGYTENPKPIHFTDRSGNII